MLVVTAQSMTASHGGSMVLQLLTNLNLCAASSNTAFHLTDE